MTGNVNGDNTPIVPLEQTGANTVLVIVTIEVTRTDPLSSYFDTNREPIGFIYRYQ